MTTKVESRKRGRRTAGKEASRSESEQGDTEAHEASPAGPDGESEEPDALLDDAGVVEPAIEDEDEDEGGESESESESEVSETESEAEPAGEERGLARFDALQAYMREVQRHPLLSTDDEHKLAVKYSETQDVETAARLVTANLRLVVKLAYEYRRAYRNIMDLVQEGNIGLMQAVKRYDPYRGVKLSSYAAWWIRAYMLRFILNNWRLVKVGTTQAQRKLFFNLNKEKDKLSAMGIEPTHAEIAKRLNVAEADVVEMDRRLSRADASLDATVNESDGRTTTRLELMPSPGDSPDKLAEGSELNQLLHERLDEFRKTLNGKDLAIFDKRLISEEPLTLQELGDEFGVSRERVRQLESRVTGKLREYLRSTLGDAVGVG
ncbi:MAG TPA: RNA polymerase factor sigma-32 [Polyangiaceae bacterium]